MNTKLYMATLFVAIALLFGFGLVSAHADQADDYVSSHLTLGQPQPVQAVSPAKAATAELQPVQLRITHIQSQQATVVVVKTTQHHKLVKPAIHTMVANNVTTSKHTVKSVVARTAVAFNRTRVTTQRMPKHIAATTKVTSAKHIAAAQPSQRLAVGLNEFVPTFFETNTATNAEVKSTASTNASLIAAPNQTLKQVAAIAPAPAVATTTEPTGATSVAVTSANDRQTMEVPASVVTRSLSGNTQVADTNSVATTNSLVGAAAATTNNNTAAPTQPRTTVKVTTVRMRRCADGGYEPYATVEERGQNGQPVAPPTVVTPVTPPVDLAIYGTIYNRILGFNLDLGFNVSKQDVIGLSLGSYGNSFVAPAFSYGRWFSAPNGNGNTMLTVGYNLGSSGKSLFGLQAIKQGSGPFVQLSGWRGTQNMGHGSLTYAHNGDQGDLFNADIGVDHYFHRDGTGFGFTIGAQVTAVDHLAGSTFVTPGIVYQSGNVRFTATYAALVSGHGSDGALFGIQTGLGGHSGGRAADKKAGDDKKPSSL